MSALLAAALYGIAWSFAWRSAFAAIAPGADDRAEGGRPPGPDAANLALAGAVAAHVIALLAGSVAGEGFRFGFAPALSATFLVGIVMLMVERLRSRVDAMRVVVLPATALAVLLPLFFPGSDFAASRDKPLFMPHLLCGTLAYGVLLLAAFHAGLMRFAERSLHAGGANATPFSRWIERLPPLLVLERILFRLIGFGFLLLTLTAISGVLFSEQVFGRALTFDHKTVFSLVSWALFGALLLGRRLRGWRGRIALRFTLTGFGLLVLAYVGSRFVLEVVLQRT